MGSRLASDEHIGEFFYEAVAHRPASVSPPIYPA